VAIIFVALINLSFVSVRFNQTRMSYSLTSGNDQDKGIGIRLQNKASLFFR